MTSIKNAQDISIAPDKLKLKLPSIYKVIILNDDYTPMEFVVFTIQKVFNKNLDELISDFPIQRIRFSKYCFAIQNLYNYN